MKKRKSPKKSRRKKSKSAYMGAGMTKKEYDILKRYAATGRI